MLKKTIVYEDYNGNEVTEDFYFNLSKAELVELQLSTKIGFAETLQEIIKAEDGQQIIDHFKKIILMAVGQKSEDGRRFIKTQEIRDDFSQTEAYSQLFVDLATNAEGAAEFIKGIVPVGMAQEVEAEVNKIQADSVELPTTPSLLQESNQKIETKNPKEMSREELMAAMHQKIGE